METKYGKVYVLQRDTAADGKEQIASKLLDSTLFSNVDFKWYDADGKLSSFYEKYKGRSFAVQFHFNQKDKTGQQVELSGKFDLPYKLGQVAHQDFESVAEASEEMKKFWRTRGVLSDDVVSDDGYNTMRKLQSAAMVAACCPGCKISDVRAFHTWVDPIFISDDYMEKATPQDSKPLKISHHFWSTMSMVLEGKPFHLGEMECTQISKHDRKLKCGMQEFRKVIVAKKGDPTYVFQTLKDFHDAVALENCLEWKQKKGDPCSRMYTALQEELRAVVVGGLPTFEIILFDKGIEVSRNIRESFLFKSIVKAFSQHSFLINDVMSLKKEMYDDIDPSSITNLIYSWHHTDGLSMEEAYKEALDKIDALSQVVKETGEFLIQLYGEEASPVVNTIVDIMYGHIQWLGITKRYHADMRFDCIVGLM